MADGKGTPHTDALARYLTRRERVPPKMTGSSTAGGVDTETAVWTLPIAIGDPGDVLTVVVNGDGDTVPDWVAGYARTVTASATATGFEGTILADATGGSITVTLPPAADGAGPITVKKTDSSANAVTIDPDGSETVDGGSAYAITAQWGAVTVVSDGTGWYVVSEVA